MTRVKEVVGGVIVSGVALAMVFVYPGARAQTKAQRLAFEVASVKRSAQQGPFGDAGGRKGGGGGGSCGSFRTGLGEEAAAAAFQAPTRRLCLQNRPLLRLIYDAYEIRGCPNPREECGLVVGGPAWIRTDLFDIDARAPEESPAFTKSGYASAPHVREMLQALLADRFGLQLHREARELPVYALEVSEKGHKLKANSTRNEFTAPFGFGKPRQDVNYLELRAYGLSMPDLAALLSSTRATGRHVVDRTNLSGTFDFQTSFADQNNTDSSSAPSIFSAFERDLGLKLESTRAPVEILVIDRVLPPSEN